MLKWLTATVERRIALALVALCALIYVPLAGNYGMWDPWETHYGEVARQMAHRGDFISLWYPCSPRERFEFWSKPVLPFWLMALAMKISGLESARALPSELAASWRAEWTCRMPFVLLGIAGVWATWELTRRLVGARAGVLAALVLATSSQWLLVTRQAMTDMAFVVPMTVALLFAGLALLLPDAERELPRRSLAPFAWLRRPLARLARLRLSWPHAPAFYGFALLFALTTLPQLIDFSLQLKAAFRLGHTQVRVAGIVPMLPYVLAFVVGLGWCTRARCVRQLYLFSAYVLCAVASLAKGPAGLAMPALTLVIYLVLDGRWKDLVFKLEIPRGVVLFVATAFPWYHAMLIRHGMPFWNEFIGDNYVHRATGRHGDRGGFDYYLQVLGHGLFPWSGLAAAGALFSVDDRRNGASGRLARFALIWLLVDLTVVSLVTTKFHHYILPALPAAAILTALFLDDVLESAARPHRFALVLIAVPLTLLCGRDLAALPARLLWLFNYDYVISPGAGRTWPPATVFGDRYEYSNDILIFVVFATAATVILTASSFIKRRNDSVCNSPPPSNTALLGAALLVTTALGVATWSGPASPAGVAPTIARAAWLVPAAAMLIGLGVLAGSARPVLPRRLLPLAGLSALALSSVVWSAFVVDKVLVELSPHWSQKHVIASYYAQRKSADEPLIAWQLFWHGENFYTRNQIYDAPDPAERTVFLEGGNERLPKYLAAHANRRIFFLLERGRLESLRALLPAASRPSLTVVDESNIKLYLAVANL